MEEYIDTQKTLFPQLVEQFEQLGDLSAKK